MIAHANAPDPALSSLSGVPETMLITLAARVLAPRDYPELGFYDPNARAIAQRFGFDPARFCADRKSMRGTILRALWFDRQIDDWLARHPESLCVSFGSGLDMRRPRLAHAGRSCWVDIDLPEIHQLRRRLAPGMNGGLELSGSAQDATAWISALPVQPGRPIVFLAEGVFMYLAPAMVHQILDALTAYASAHDAPLCVVFDYVSPFAMRHSHRNPSVRQTGSSFAWSLRTPQEVTRHWPALHCRAATDLTRFVDWFSFLAGRFYSLLNKGAALCGAACFETQGA